MGALNRNLKKKWNWFSKLILNQAIMLFFPLIFPVLVNLFSKLRVSKNLRLKMGSTRDHASKQSVAIIVRCLNILWFEIKSLFGRSQKFLKFKWHQMKLILVEYFWTTKWTVTLHYSIPVKHWGQFTISAHSKMAKWPLLLIPHKELVQKRTMIT